MNQTIAFIGGGNMAQSLIGGLIANGETPQNIVVSEPLAVLREKLENEFSVHCVSDNNEAIAQADCVILAVKPQVLKDIIHVHADSLKQRPILLISIAAGINQASLTEWTHPEQAIVRTMPNTPALVQLGATGMHANAFVTDSQKAMAERILGAAGITLWLDDEHLINTVTAISGSGPAYFFAFIESLESAAVELGLNPEQAHALVTQTALGAAHMAKNSADSPSILRERVTSKGGTTAAALNSFASSDLNTAVHKAARAAFERSIELSQLSKKDGES